MKYSYQKVNPKLTDYVRTVLVLEDSTNEKTSELPLVTNGMSALLCRVKNDSCQIKLFGQQIPKENWSVENAITVLAFFFKPFVIGTIFRLSQQELKEKPVQLNLWDAQKAMALNLQMLNSNSLNDHVEILTYFIQTQIKSNQRECEIIRYATDKLMENSNADALPKLLQELHLTERTFQRMFKKYVGVSPNQYRRICQFQFSFLQLKSGHFTKQTDVAYTNGYFDQSHYIRSFKEFAYTTPSEYLEKGLTKIEI